MIEVLSKTFTRYFNISFLHCSKHKLQQVRQNTTRCLVPSITVSEDHGKVLPFEAVPGPSSVPILGAGWLFLPFIGGHTVSRFDILMEELNQKYGPVVRLELPGYDSVHLFDADDIRTVFQSEGKYPVHPGIQPLKAYRQSQDKLYRFGGITTVHGDEWYEIRSRFQRHFLHIQTVESYYPKMRQVIADLIDHVKSVSGAKGEVDDTLTLLQSWSIATIYYIVFNKKLEVFRDGNSAGMHLKNAGLGIFDALAQMILGNQLWRIYPTKDWRNLVQHHETFTEISLDHILKAIKDTEGGVFTEADMSLLQTAIKNNEKKPEIAVIMALDFLLSATDTTSITASFLLYNLARNPDIQQKVYEEIETIVGVDDIRPEHVHHIKYLQACVKETLRLNPAIVGAARILDKEVVLSNYRIPPKVIIQMSTMTMMRNEKYFPEAHKFKPERWLEGFAKPHMFAYLPFGHGPRGCIGKRVAQQALHLLSSEIIHKFRLECNMDHLGSTIGITNRPDRPLALKFIPRT